MVFARTQSYMKAKQMFAQKSVCVFTRLLLLIEYEGEVLCERCAVDVFKQLQAIDRVNGIARASTDVHTRIVFICFCYLCFRFFAI